MGQNSVQPQSGALECAEMSLCAGGGDKRRGLQRAIKRRNMRRREGGGVFFRYGRVCAESRTVEISNWPPHLPVASLQLTHGVLEITVRSCELGFCWVTVTHEGAFIQRNGFKKEPGSWNYEGLELSFSTTGLFLTGTLIFLFSCIYSHLSSFIIWLISKCSSACATS